jgi:hypothetical protein
MAKPLNLKVDRSAKTTLAEQIRSEITTAIESYVSSSALGLVCLCGDQPVWTLVGRCDIADKGAREILRPFGRYHPAFQLNP